MKRGETRADVAKRVSDRNRAYVVNRLEAEERLIVQQLENVRRQIAKRQQSNQGDKS